MSELESFREAGLIARKVRDKAQSIVRDGVRVLEICEALEEMIRDHGAEPAFPCNVGINEVAAHYTATPGDLTTIPPKSIVKVDIGVSLNGYIADTATTIVLDPRLSLLAEAARTALYNAVKAMRAGVSVSKVGAVVQKTVTELGFRPIRNLTGHEIKRYNLHAGLSIPNVASGGRGRLKENHIYAVEPFVTTKNGSGEVISTKSITIFRLVSERSLKRLRGRELELAKLIAERFDTLPYTPRWIQGYEEFRRLHERMVRLGRIHGYPVLVERSGEPVAQFEHTVIVGKDGCEIIT